MPKKTSERFDKLVSEMARVGIADSANLKGCTARQIARLEEHYDLLLPTMFRHYLEVMGRSSGRLFTHDWLCTDYKYLCTATDELRSDLAEYDLEYKLPQDALVILGRDGEQFNFIRCRGTADSSVWVLNLADDPIRARVFKRSVLGWLREWMDEAAEAIASGWYERR